MTKVSPECPTTSVCCANDTIDKCRPIWIVYRIRRVDSVGNYDVTPSPWHLPIDISRDPEFRSMDYLAEVEERIKHKIEQIEEEMDNTYERENTDILMPKIETLNWVLNEILVLDREG